MYSINFKKSGFTLAEIMIVLSIIGILTAILLPIANHSRPDENVMKFKKANVTLARAINELVNSDEYYLNGDLSTKKDGSKVDSATYFCETLAQVLTTKTVNCQSQNTGAHSLSHYNVDISVNDTSEANANRLIDNDDKCKQAISKGMKAEIVTPDGIEFYQTNPAYHFASKWTSGNVDDTIPASDGVSGELFNDFRSTNGFKIIYKPICIDVDGIGKGEDPFAFGIRVDGKILMSKRAHEWLEKDFQKGSNEN